MDAERALEVDHIMPKNVGGADQTNNYQALCYSCNAMKRDTDAIDFRGINERYQHREEDCKFCNIPVEILSRRRTLWTLPLILV